jgi:tetratricopeptide (TPR) repeat protein
VLFRLGFRDLVLDLVPYRPVASLHEPLEFYQYQWRDLTRYVASVGSRNPVPPTDSFEMVDHPDCPLHLRLTVSTFGIVFAARETKSVDDALRWRARAAELLADVLAADDFTPFEKTMLESRFYRGAGFTPFMTGDRDGMVADMARAEELARAVPATTPWEEFLKRENLHACLESRSKEAYAVGDVALAHARTEEFLALDPYDPKSHIELAECLAKQGRFAEAGDSYLRAARLGPLGTAIAAAMAGASHERAGNAVVAEDCFVQSLRVDPYAVSAARGWRRVATDGLSDLAAEYAGQLEDWGAERQRR